MNSINSASYKKSFIFFLICVNLLSRIQKRRWFICQLNWRVDWKNWAAAWKFYEGTFDVEGKNKRLDEIGKMMADPNFWEGGETAQKILKERTSILESLSPWQHNQKELEEMEILLQLIEDFCFLSLSS